MEATSATSSTASSVDGRSVGGGAATATAGSDYLNLGMFNQQSGGGGGGQQPLGDLLGAAGAGFLQNGFENSNNPNVVGSSVAPGTSFDLSDFPSLGGTGNVQAGSVGGNGLAAALRQQQQIMAHQQMLQNSSTVGVGGGVGVGNVGAVGGVGIGGGNVGAGNAGKSSNLYRLAMTGNGNFNMATEDFPALSGAPPVAGGVGPGQSLGSGSLLAGGTNSGVVSRGSSNGNVGGLYGNEIDSGNTQLDGAGLLGGAGLGGLGGLRGLQQAGSGQGSSLSRTPSAAPSAGAIGNPAASGGGSGSAAGSALSGDYGLLGLLGVIRMTDADRNALALGSDLAMLGLNLGTSEQIYSTFASPWNDGAAKEPHYQLPNCYYMQPPALKTGHLSKFQLETLFYIFYALPKDVLQAYAAQELYSREWVYHGDLKLWFKRAGPSDGVATVAGGPQQYLYFDINSCERRLFNGNMQNITSGFLPEDEVRVKFPSS